jgi:hypothetical protein
VGEGRTDRPEPTARRVTVSEAAGLLGITPEAVRMRIKRGTLTSERRDGRVFVLLGPDRPTEHTTERTDPTDHRDRDELIAQLRSEVEAWREEARRKDHLLMAALERIPAIEAPTGSPSPGSDAPGPPSGGEDTPGRGETPGTPETPAQRPSWWRRIWR